jgi:hypothetical protein
MRRVAVVPKQVKLKEWATRLMAIRRYTPSEQNEHHAVCNLLARFAQEIQSECVAYLNAGLQYDNAGDTLERFEVYRR